MSTFEDRLWTYLADEHGAEEVSSKAARSDPGRRIKLARAHRSRLALAGSMVAAMTAAVVLLVSAIASPPPAYALTRHPNGSITVTINDLQTAIPQLNARFASMGVDETVIPITRDCPSQLSVPAFPQSAENDTFTFTPNEGHEYLPAGYNGVLAAGYTSSGQLLLFIGALKPPLPACFPPRPLVVGPPSGSVGPTAGSRLGARRARLR